MIELACEALLFDLDGVLVDSAACVERVLATWAARHSLEPRAVYQAGLGRRTIETIQLVAPHLDAEQEAVVLTAAESTTTEGIAEVPGARGLVASIPRHRWAIVTSGARAVATLRLRATGLPVPDVLLCAEDVVRGKPDPTGYLAAATRLDATPDACIVIEDAPAGLAAARAAGMRSIGIAGSYPAAALRDATHVVSALAALRVSDGGQGSPLRVRFAPA
jgi:sugar-phosphatase